jgi:hypothetical protein
MSDDLVRVVRPFQTSDIGPPKVVTSSANAAGPQNVIINPGKNGAVKTFSGSFSLTITYYFIKKPKEKKKEQ